MEIIIIHLQLCSSLHHLPQPSYNFLRLTLNPLQQLLTSRYIFNQPHYNTRAPNSIIGISILINESPSSTWYQFAKIFEFGAAWATFESNYFHRDFVLEYARCVAQGAEDVDCILFVWSNDFLFDILVYRATKKTSVGGFIMWGKKPFTSQRYT